MSRSLGDWLTYLYNLHVRSIDLELGRLQRVAHILQIKQPPCPVVTVAGTNGKGSVVNFLETLYVNAGYKVAAFTSPYLISFNEQFRFNQQWIDDEKLCGYFERINNARENITLTYFEFKTLAALLYFSELPLDLMILEVGLGGRLDSVNIIDPDIAVITSISLDHCDQLGNTRELIACEKAGIFRSGKAAVCGDLNPPATIQEVADEVGAQVFYRNKDFYIREENDTWAWHGKNIILKNLPEPILLKDNIATGLKVFELLSCQRRLEPSLNHLTVNKDRLGPSLRWGEALISDQLICETIASVSVPGRQQIISQNPFIVVDVSHNEDSVRRLTEFLDRHHKKKVIAIFSVLKTKDFESMAKIISPYITEWHIAEIDHPSAMSLGQIQAILQQRKVENIITHASILAAYRTVRESCAQEIIVFGSFYVVNEVLTGISISAD